MCVAGEVRTGREVISCFPRQTTALLKTGRDSKPVERTGGKVQEGHDEPRWEGQVNGGYSVTNHWTLLVKWLYNLSTIRLFFLEELKYTTVVLQEKWFSFSKGANFATIKCTVIVETLRPWWFFLVFSRKTNFKEILFTFIIYHMTLGYKGL